MSADFTKESGDDSSKSEELHGWLGHQDSRKPVPLYTHHQENQRFSVDFCGCGGDPRRRTITTITTLLRPLATPRKVNSA